MTTSFRTVSPSFGTATIRERMLQGNRMRVVAAAVVLACALYMPGSLLGQWTSGSGGSIYYNSGPVGIGFTNPNWPFMLNAAGNTQMMFLVGGNAIALVGEAAGLFPYTGANDLGILSWGNTYIGYIGAQSTPFLTITSAGNVGIFTKTPQSLLAVNGTITTREVVVTSTGWPDYVFGPSYRLKPLTEVASFIKENHHLPDIPSEAEVKEKGVGVGDMQAKLLAKIEELTLHLIQADEKNRELQERIVRLESQSAPNNPAR